MRIQIAHVAGSALILFSGCVSGSYDAAATASLQRYRQASAFQRLRPEPHRLADDRLTLRVPKLFTAEDAAGDQERSKPPFLQDFPGFRIAFESLAEVDGAKMPVVLSVGVLTDKESGLDDLKKRILGQVQKEPAFAKAAWTAVEGRADAATNLSWSLLTLAGQQPFDREVNGVVEKKNSEGETQVWVASEPESKVATVLVWRVPQERAPGVPLSELAALVASTVGMRPAAEPAAAAP